MRFADPYNPTGAELRDWAADADAIPPHQEWELELAWGMEPGRLRVIVELAADPTSRKARYFLRLLYTWVYAVARRQDFDSWRVQFDRWLDQAKGVRDPAVKRWRHRARLIFQAIEPFNAESWWAALSAEE